MATQREEDDLAELQEQTVEELFDSIGSIEIDTEYTFVEKVEERIASGETLSPTRWSRVQRLHKKYVKPTC